MPNKAYHHGDLKEALIETGIKLVSQSGIESFSLRKVANLCDVSHAAPYAHFKNKEELLQAMQEYITSKLVLEFNNILSNYKNKNELKIIIDLGKSYITFFTNNPQYFSFVFTQSNIKINLSIEEKKDSYLPFEIYKATALKVFKANDFDENKLQDIIISCWATVHGLTSIATMSSVNYDKAWEDKLEDIIWNK